MADAMHDYAHRWSEKMPECGRDIVVSWQTPDGAKGMTWCFIGTDGRMNPKTEIPRNALLFGWVYYR